MSLFAVAVLSLAALAACGVGSEKGAKKKKKAATTASSSRRSTTSETTPTTTTPTTTPSSAPDLSKKIEAPLLVEANKTTGVVAVAKITIHGKPYLFKVDTGAGSTIIDTKLARQIGLKAAGKAQTSTQISCKSTSQPVRIDDWQLSGKDLPDGTIVSTLVSDAGKKVGGVPFAGQLGSDVMSTFGSVSIDFPGRKLVLGGSGPTGGKKVPVKVKSTKGQVLAAVDLTIKGKSKLFVVDTGASTSVIDSKEAKGLGLMAAGTPKKGKAISCPATVTPTKIADWKAGTVALPDGIIAATDSQLTKQSGGQLAGLFGADVMFTFKTVTLDYKGKTLTLGGS